MRRYNSRYNNVVVRKIKQFAAGEEGVAFIEFVFSIPVLLLMLYGAVEMSRYALINKKLQQVSSTVANIVTQYTQQTISPSAMGSVITNVAPQIMAPYPFNGSVIITDGVIQNGSFPLVWQYCSSGSNSQSHIYSGSAAISYGTTYATMPPYSDRAVNSLQSSSAIEVIVTEVSYTFTPLFGGTIIPASTLYKVAYFVPRGGDGQLRNGVFTAFDATCTSR